MEDWTSAFSHQRRPANAKIPVKVHRNVSMIRTHDSFIARELLSRPTLSRFLSGRLTDDVLLVQPGHVDDVLEVLKKMGKSPKIVDGK